MESQKSKLFIGGIPNETTEELLLEYFSNYGEVEKSEVIRDRYTGRGRGFGFITFADSSTNDIAIKEKHVILGKTVEVKAAKPKDNRLQENSEEGTSSNNQLFEPMKVFVGGLPLSLTLKDLIEYFEPYGKIVNSFILPDKELYNRFPGFGFVEFDSQEAVENVLSKCPHKISDKFVDVKRATLRKKTVSPLPPYNSVQNGFEFFSDPRIHGFFNGFNCGYLYGASYPYSESSYYPVSQSGNWYNYGPYYGQVMPYWNSYPYPTLTKTGEHMRHNVQMEDVASSSNNGCCSNEGQGSKDFDSVGVSNNSDDVLRTDVVEVEEVADDKITYLEEESAENCSSSENHEGTNYNVDVAEDKEVAENVDILSDEENGNPVLKNRQGTNPCDISSDNEAAPFVEIVEICCRPFTA